MDAFIGAVEAGGRPENFAGDIAEHLIGAGRPMEALAWLDRARNRHEGEDWKHLDLRLEHPRKVGFWSLLEPARR